jgi:hypothetical protein
LKQFKRLYNFYFRISAIIFGKQSKTKNTNHLRLVFFEFGLDVGDQIMHQRKIKLSRKNAWCYFMIELRIGGFPILACLDDETSAFEDPPKDTTD